jgi:tRNA threonylcarbamoyladenosine biosynthesis protein TsaB
LELSIDTSTSFCSIAISYKGKVTKELTWDARRNHSVELCPAIWTMMDELKLKPSNLKSVFLAKGPGLFSSLRVGMSFAKTVSLTLRIPLVSIGTLDIEIDPYIPSVIPVYAMIKASTKSVYSINNIDPIKTVKVVNLEDIENITNTETVFCGEGMSELGEYLISKLGNLAIVKGETPPSRKASTLARLGYEKLMTCGGEEIHGLEPVYIRGSQYESAKKHSIQIDINNQS